ncbi:MAG: hypothetical protein CL780_06780 [Chloroflexi bacterium]|mgnify:FL=1|nr:hypothetical protein [Chloroflexota bacterium]
MFESLVSFAAISSAFWWASSGGFIKSVRTKTTIVFPFIEALISGLVIASIIFIRNGWGDFLSYSIQTYIFMMIASFFSMSGVVMFYLSIRKIPLGIVYTISASLQVLMAVILDLFFNMIIPQIGVILGGIIILLGIMAINFFSSNNKGKEVISLNVYAYGIVLSSIAGILWSFGNFFNDRALIEANPLMGALFRSFGPIIIIGFLLLFFFRNEFVDIDKKDWSMLIPGSLCITFAMLSWFISLNVNSVSLNSIFISISPVFALLIGLIFYKERIGLYEFIGIILCLVGTILVILNR